jgi:glycosyltransferase involved in cell wall biosynthesis
MALVAAGFGELRVGARHTTVNIAMVSHYFEAHRGGVEIAAGQLARAFIRLGHRVTWLACGCDAPPADLAVCDRAIPLPAVNWLEWRAGIPYPLPLPPAGTRLRQAFRAADLVVIHDGAYLSSVLAQRAARRSGRPVVLIQHIGSVPYRNAILRAAMWVLERGVTRPALVAADQIVFISDVTRRHFATVRLRRPGLLLFNGVDTDVFRPLPAGRDRGAIRRALGLHPTRPTVLFVGRFVEKKGLHHLERMVQRRPDWSWVVAGWGSIDPNAWRLPNVRVVCGRSGAGLAPLYHAADALVLPSVGEGYPLVIQEALACGLPVVCGSETASADPAASAFVTGVPVCAGDPAATAERFIAALAKRMAAGSADDAPGLRAAFARAHYSWDGMARQLIAACVANDTADDESGATLRPVA